jgi:predicted Zn-ribbon and HTH transcriptional regulator
MTFLNNLKEKLESLNEAKEKARSAILVDSEIKSERLSICQQCEFLFHPTQQCKKCGCFVHAKTSLTSSSCPIGKWKSIEIIRTVNSQEEN